MKFSKRSYYYLNICKLYSVNGNVNVKSANDKKNTRGSREVHCFPLPRDEEKYGLVISVDIDIYSNNLTRKMSTKEVHEFLKR